MIKPITRGAGRLARGAVRSQRFLADLFRYASFGALAFVTDYTIFNLLESYSELGAFQKTWISRPIGAALSFLMHKYLTFQNRGARPTPLQAAWFVTVWLVGFAVSLVLLQFYTEVIGWGDRFAKLSAEGGAGLVAFVCNRHVTFRGNLPKKTVGGS